VNAIALNSEGKRGEALAALRAAEKRHPNNLEVLSALISINREAGDRQAALRYARQAAVLLPDNANLTRLVAELEGK
jgi:predicted Zn-dependent protease